MIYTQTIEKDIHTVQEDLRAKVKDFSFGILKEYAFKEILQGKGFPIEKEITVFEICNPSAAQAVLSKHPELSVYLPCRISVYEMDSKTIVSTIELEDIFNSFELEDALKTHMLSIFENLKKLIASLE
ncbi:MAG: DUF302 domain-containing protein [Sulfurimonas sp.]|nr:DUF302 domain-containing protein [Sulfurimonas sp.]